MLSLIEELREQNAQLTARVQDLEEKLNTNSRNSSKPPSSDGPGKGRGSDKKTGKGKATSRRKQGAQPGHKGSRRTALPPEQVNDFVPHYPSPVCQCGADIEVTVHPGALSLPFR